MREKMFIYMNDFFYEKKSERKKLKLLKFHDNNNKCIIKVKETKFSYIFQNINRFKNIIYL